MPVSANEKGERYMKKMLNEAAKLTNMRLGGGLTALALCLILALSVAAPGCKGGKDKGKKADAGKDKAAEVVVVKMEKGGSNVTLAQLDDAWEKEVPDMNKQQFIGMPDWQKKFVDYWVNMAVLSEMARKEKLQDSEEFKTMMSTKETQILAALYLQKKLTPKLEKLKAKPEDAEAYYKKNKNDFYQGWREISQIIVPSREEAEAIYAQVSANPATFAAVAKAKSKDTATASNGGYVGKVFRGMATVLPEVELVASKTPKGGVSKPLNTRWGWAIVYVKDASTLDYLPLDDQLKQQILRKVENDKKMEEFEKIMAGFKKELGVKVDNKNVPKVGDAWKKKLEEAMKKAPPGMNNPHGGGGMGGAAPQGGASPHGGM